jgi:hypothetical protein
MYLYLYLCLVHKMFYILSLVLWKIYGMYVNSNCPCTFQVSLGAEFITSLHTVYADGWETVSELQPPMGLLFILQMIYEYGEPWWNDTNRRKLNNLEKNLPQCHYVNHESHMNWSRHEPGSLQSQAGD